MKEADHGNVKMKWFAGNTSTHAEGKFEYQEPKLLRVSRITEGDKRDDSNQNIENHKKEKKVSAGMYFHKSMISS